MAPWIRLLEEVSNPQKKATTRKSQRAKPQKSQRRLYTLEVYLTYGCGSKSWVKPKNTIARTIQIRGDQTLEELHFAIFDAYDRFDEHMYEFQFGDRPMDPKGPRYVLECAYDSEDTPPCAGVVDDIFIDELDLTLGQRFGYWFDFGDDWWHGIAVKSIEDKAPRGKFPKVIQRVGKSPPQYPNDEDDD